MNRFLPLLAELDESEKILLKNMGHSGWSQMTIIFASLGAVAAFLFLVVFLFRKQLFRKHRRHRHHSSDNTPAATSPAASGDDRRRRKGNLRREHRPLNPTLAQTRGLPPIRDEGTPPHGL